MGRKPLYVDLDVGQGDISVPGTIGAAQLDTTCIDVEEGFSFSIPLVYWYGSASMAKNKALFKALIDKLASTISQRFDKNPEGMHLGPAVCSVLAHSLLTCACPQLGVREWL